MMPHRGKESSRVYRKPQLRLQTTTLWDYPSRHYGDNDAQQGQNGYAGATPSYVIWNLLTRYTREGDLVIDPMCGSGTTLDVCRDLKRHGLGYDIAPARPDIVQADARKLPLDSGIGDFLFADPPYGNHLRYSGKPECIGELEAGPAYYSAMDLAIAEFHRVLKEKRFLGLYVCDSFRKGKPFAPIGFELFARLCRYFRPIDIICVSRHNKNLKKKNWHNAALEGNYFLRGFNYLFIMKKDSGAEPGDGLLKSARLGSRIQTDGTSALLPRGKPART